MWGLSALRAHDTGIQRERGSRFWGSRMYRVSQSETNRGSKLGQTSAASAVRLPSSATACADDAAPPAFVV
jgi:hypothetical protein